MARSELDKFLESIETGETKNEDGKTEKWAKLRFDVSIIEMFGIDPVGEMMNELGNLIDKYREEKKEQEKEPKEQKKILCRMCGKGIIIKGKYWYHLCSNPRHPATPEGED